MRRHTALVAAFFIFSSWTSAFAAVTTLPAAAGERLVLSLGKAQVQLSSGAAGQIVLQSSGTCPDWSVENKPGQILVRDLNLAKSRVSAESLCLLQVQVPEASSVHLHLLEGSLQARKMKSDLLIHVQKGKISLFECSGSGAVSLQKGELLISDGSGKQMIEIQQAQLVVKNHQGDLEIKALGGEHVIEKSRGAFRLSQAMGSLKVTGGAGSLQFDTQKSNLSTELFGGRIEGQTSEGNINLKLPADADVSLKNQSGKISISAAGGTSVNLFSAEGEILVPAGIGVNREGSSKSVRGRTKGEGGRGSVIVRSQEGLIQLR